MIAEIGAGLIAAGSVVAAATSMVQSRKRDRANQVDLDDARQRAEALKHSLGVSRKLASDHAAVINSRDLTIRNLDALNTRIIAERDDARRALQAAQPVRGERGRFAKRQQLTSTSVAVSGKRAGTVIVDEFETLSKI